MELLSVLAMENIRFWRNKRYMAGINVPQYEIFKIGTDKLKYSKWNLNIDKKEAFKYQESVSLFEGQQFRIMAKKIMKKAGNAPLFFTERKHPLDRLPAQCYNW